ncbi:protein MENT [Thamnophis elegans]|uniref:protein MENT n=1 Tax=Thamnophis elegans TaxID=35005 RepID=UPI001377E014|nr:protein MENT [Thamnophis elegans]
MPMEQAGEGEEWAWVRAPPPHARSSRSFVPRAGCLASPREPVPARTEGPRTPMAPGRPLALLLLLSCWLWAAELAEPPDDEGALVSAPPELLAKLPAAARATVAAGYLNPSEAAAVVSKEMPRLQATPVGTPPAGSTPGETVLIVGDTRYAWQEWSAWHCNCPAGSMARVRDITYAAPAVRLDPAQYDLLRFERLVCSYAICGCDRRQRQCDRLAPACDLGQMHFCALRDIQRDQDEKRRRFWAKVNGGLKALWRSLKAAFPSDQKKLKNKHAKRNY